MSFYLEPIDGQPLAAYVPGQFLTFQIELPDAVGVVRTITRCYSLSDRPDPLAYRITVKRVAPPADRPDLPPGLVSGYLHDTATAGTVLQVRAPAGVFVLDADATTPVVLIAGGIGITPLFAMARGSLTRDPGRAIHLLRLPQASACEDQGRSCPRRHPPYRELRTLPPQRGRQGRRAW